MSKRALLPPVKAPRRVANDDACPMFEEYDKRESVNVGVYDGTMRRVASCGFCCARVGGCGLGHASYLVNHRRAR